MSYSTQPPQQGGPYGQAPSGYSAQEHRLQVAHTPQQQLQVQQQQQRPKEPAPGHGLRYSHPANMPFFVLSDGDAAARVAHNAQQAAIFHDYCLGELRSEPELTGLEKTGKMALEVFTGADLISPDHIHNNILKMSMGINHLAILDAQLTDHLILTRWTLLPVEAGQPLVVDVLEYFSTRVKWANRSIVVKANQPVELRVRGKYVANLHKMKSLQKGWTKSFNKKPVDTMALIVDGKDMPLEMVLKVKRVVTSSEQTPIYVRFWKEWLVPS